MSISPSLSLRQYPNRYAFRAGRNLPDKEFRSPNHAFIVAWQGVATLCEACATPCCGGAVAREQRYQGEAYAERSVASPLQGQVVGQSAPCLVLSRLVSSRLALLWRSRAINAVIIPQNFSAGWTLS